MVGHEPHIATVSAIATVGASINDRALTSKRHAPRAAVTPSNIELALINKLRHNKHASDTPALS